DCDSVGLDGGEPRCTGGAPLSLTLVPVTAPGVKSFHWTVDDGGVPSSTQDESPRIVWPMPGRYAISLTVAGTGGAASALATVQVLAGRSGAHCRDDHQCKDGLVCLCSPAALSDGGAPSCPGDLAAGMCARACTGGDCDTGEVCVDLSRSAAGNAQAM